MARSRLLLTLGAVASLAAASESREGTCVQDAVAAVQARMTVPEVREKIKESADGVDIIDSTKPGLFLHKELHLDLPPELESGRIGLLAMVQRGRVSVHKKFDCAASPHMCQAPFDCQNWTLKDTVNVMLHGLASKDGHANPRSWCLPGAEEYAHTILKECVAGRGARGAAELLRSVSSGLGSQEMDASYCFAEGHCSNEAVTDDTTMEETEAMCDHRFGRSGWTKDLLKSFARSFTPGSSLPNLVHAKHGFNSRAVTAALTKMSCAQGVYHCDVQFCKHTYCKDEKYKAKYSFLKPPQAGHLIQDLASPEV